MHAQVPLHKREYKTCTCYIVALTCTISAKCAHKDMKTCNM